LSVEPVTSIRLEELLPDDALLASVRHKALAPVAQSDLVRLALLRRYGGVWADATTYCLRPLDTWLPERANRGFFAFARPSARRMVASWLLAADVGNHIVDEWYRAAHEYWSSHSEPDDYFWLHNLFAKSYAADARFRELWDAIPELSAAGPHRFVPYRTLLFGPLGEDDQRFVEQAEAPVLKLTHKLGREDVPAGSVLEFLMKRAAARK